MTAADTRPAADPAPAHDAAAPPAESGTRTLRAPATRDQVDAYRFGQRRLEAALIRADPVPLHEQIRSQRRAAFAGVLLGLLALGVAGLLAKLSPATDWQQKQMVVGDRSGTVYVVTPEPRRLVPVANLVAGRLVLAALGEQGGTAVPATVSDDTLATAPRTPPAAVAGAVGVRPDGPPVPPAWAVCDTQADPRAEGAGPGTTTVLAGALGAPSGPAPGLLVAGRGGSSYVVLDGVRHRVDTSDRAAMAALGVLGVPTREVSDGLLSALPEGAPLRTPEIDAGVTVAGLGRAGDVVTSNPLGAEPSYYVVLGPDAATGRAGGLAPVPVTLADAVLARSGQGEPATLAQGQVAQSTLSGTLDTDGWPAARIARADPSSIPTLCWTWRDGRSGVVATDRLPVAAGAVTIDLAGADGAGPRLDAVVLAATGPGPVESRGSTGGGTRWLLSSAGVFVGVADDRTAAALGTTTTGRAPEEALRLLPRAPALDLGAVREIADVLPPG
ncbi:type VII secretion protein EccB [Pseudonocardia sediminis]|uniref:Type VII secretion protein EccB n=1 Tax=Pseudonocardia sediminis TaxID=1397368 RepID=A0A4Q7V6L5_PSEST|nr:type VII secretion protein EccB [Pseudonocardia sediminis]RZT88349.1 type VII secretion protein EccB [Pseudonocardia sediminis]